MVAGVGSLGLSVGGLADVDVRLRRIVSVAEGRCLRLSLLLLVGDGCVSLLGRMGDACLPLVWMMGDSRVS
jgi:hypothetical protein